MRHASGTLLVVVLSACHGTAVPPHPLAPASQDQTEQTSQSDQGEADPGGEEAQEDEFEAPWGEDNEFFDVDDWGSSLDRLPFTVHGRADLLYYHFGSSQNVDDLDHTAIDTQRPAILLRYDFNERLAWITEIEFEGDSNEVDVEELMFRLAIPEVSSHLDLGINIIPFGIERHYYSPVSNPLIDRPSPFRRILPGTYSDWGVFTYTKLTSDAGRSFTAELAATRGLKGPGREDRADDIPDASDELQGSGRLALAPLPGFAIGASGLFVQPNRRGVSQMILLGGDVAWTGDNHHVRFEYIEGPVQQRPVVGPNFRRKGWYAEVMRRFPWEDGPLRGVELVFRYDALDENSRVKDHRDVARWAFGFNLLFPRNFRLKLEYEINDERHEEISNNAFFAQLVWHF